ncbi:MAG: AraC family transcriptional regulator [Spirochaetaceae bacterium]
MIHLPVFEYIQLKDSVVPVHINEQKRMNNSMGSELHWHEAIEFYFVLEGGVEVLCNGKKQWLYTGDTGYIGWCDLHKGTGFLDNTRFLTVQIDLSSLDKSIYNDGNDRILGQYKNFPTYIKQDKSLIELALSLREEFHQKDAASAYMIRSYIYQIIGRLLRLGGNGQKNIPEKYPESLNLVKKILFYISRDSNSQITLDDMSRELSVTKNHLCRVFKHHTNQTILHYINEVRCLTALSLIQNGVSYTDACYESGFNDYNYFSRVFKKNFGKSPRNYLKIHTQ